jgi:hypothetical protein
MNTLIRGDPQQRWDTVLRSSHNGEHCRHHDDGSPNHLHDPPPSGNITQFRMVSVFNDCAVSVLPSSRMMLRFTAKGRPK